jgi:hypothetical protein
MGLAQDLLLELDLGMWMNRDDEEEGGRKQACLTEGLCLAGA